MITPTIGRVVWFHMSGETKDSRADFVTHSEQPHTALIVHVWGDNCVNLTVFDHNGVPFQFTSVTLLQDDETPNGAGMWAEWMPFQKGQAALLSK